MTTGKCLPICFADVCLQIFMKTTAIIILKIDVKMGFAWWNVTQQQQQ